MKHNKTIATTDSKFSFNLPFIKKGIKADKNATKIIFVMTLRKYELTGNANKSRNNHNLIKRQHIAITIATISVMYGATPNLNIR